MDEKTFPNGRHRGKTYLEVFKNDEEYCQMVLGGEKSNFIPEDFLSYLKEKNMKPLHDDSDGRKFRAEDFIKAMIANKSMKIEFFKIIGQRDEDIKIEQVHRIGESPVPNTFLGIFYKFFIQKHIANVANKNCHSNFINHCASIFPFPVSDKLSIADMDDNGILSMIRSDQTFVNEMQTFLNEHFDQVELCSILDLFFANILNCRANVVDERAIRNVLRNANLTEVLADTKNISENAIIERNNYLANYPRLNDCGIERYRTNYFHFKDICEFYEKLCEISSDKYDGNYLRNLPEINFYELYSLLDYELFNGRPFVYLYRLKKYLFFFVNALNSESKPVFFIDDMLFECLLHYTTFKEPSRDIDVLDLKYELSVLSLTYSRKFDIRRNMAEFHEFVPDENNLRLVKRHLDSFSDLEDVSIGRYIRTEILDMEVKICTNEIIMDVRFKQPRHNTIRHFWTLVLQGALINENVERLVIYNAYLGEEASIKMPNKQSVINFIRKYNGHDFLKELVPEKFSPWRESDEGDFANWNPKIGFNM